MFAEHFVVMKKLTRLKIGLKFIGKNNVVLDTRHGLIHFPHLTIQIKIAPSETTAKSQSVICVDILAKPPRTTKTITALVERLTECNTTGTVTPLDRFKETGSLLISHTMSTIFDKRITVKVTNTTDSQNLIKKNTQIAEFSVVTPDQSNYIKPVDMAILSMIPQSDSELTANLNEFLGANRPEQQNNTFRFPSPENPSRPADYIPIPTRILKEIIDLKEKEKLNPLESTENRTNFLKRFGWTDTLLIEKKRNKQLKTSWSTIMKFSPDTEWILGQ